MKWIRIIVTVVFIAVMGTGDIYAGDYYTGTLRGRVVDTETQSLLTGANVVVMHSSYGGATDSLGRFVIRDLPVGSYTLRVTYIGYKPVIKTDVIIKSDRSTNLELKLQPTPLESEALRVSAGYFSALKNEPVGVARFSGEEIRRAPGSGGDVSRILMSLPSVAVINDQSNALIVRGGNPMENSFYIDNIEIPNINHFPDLASSGGPIGMVSVDFIRDVKFHTGGFPVKYGDRLSSVMDISFREGSREGFEGQLDLNFAGFGGAAEGPLPKEKGSFMISAHRSYLDFVVKHFHVGSTVAPRYGDYQGKIVYDMSSQHRISLIGLHGDDHNAPGREVALKNQMLRYGRQDIYQGTTGLNWRALWNRHGYSKTSISYTVQRFNEKWYETNTGDFSFRNHTDEEAIKLRNVNRLRLGPRWVGEFGMEADFLMAKYDNLYSATTDPVGNPVPEIRVSSNKTAETLGLYTSLLWRPTVWLNTTLGLRADYFSRNESFRLSPRIGVSFQFTEGFSVNGSLGLFRQQAPLLLLAQNPDNSSLYGLKAVHYIVGLEQLLAWDTRVTLELYHKDYQGFPMDPDQPGTFIIDQESFTHYDNLSDKGLAFSRGVELMIQKKLARNFYGIAGLSLFRSKYRGLDAVWRPRKYDNRVLVSIDGGYKPGKNWEFSVRWMYAGGSPYTPLDIQKSREQHRAIRREVAINQMRFPAYHSLNLRADRRFHFSHQNIVVYLSVWNAYDRKNVATYYWNEQEEKRDVIHQWRILPIFGVEYEI
mgnify:CR=1 FL=1